MKTFGIDCEKWWGGTSKKVKSENWWGGTSKKLKIGEGALWQKWKVKRWWGGTKSKVKRGEGAPRQKRKEVKGHLVKSEKKWGGTSSKVKREKRGGGTSSSSSMIPDNSSSVRGPRSSAENWKNINLCHFESTYIKLSQINLHAWLSHQINSHIKPLKVSVEMKPWPSLLQILITFITSIHMNDETMDE